MPTLTDARFDALRVLVPAAPPTTNDMLRQYLIDNGGTGLHINDLWFTFLIANGATPGHRNDMAREFLTAQGFTQPQLNDAWLAFWLAGGSLGPVIPAGNLDLPANVFENIASFGTNESNCGIRVGSNGVYQFSVEADTIIPFWQDYSVPFPNDFWLDDGGASAAQFEAMLDPLNIGSLLNPVWEGWSGFNQWLPCNQNLSLLDANNFFAPSGGGFIVQVHIREIAVPGNTVNGEAAMTCMNNP